MLYGYGRVSTRDQDLTSQVVQLTASGCARVFTEKASGAKGDRAELAKVLRKLTQGDVLVVTRLDRLARSTRDLLNVIDAVTKHQVHSAGKLPRCRNLAVSSGNVLAI